MTPLRQKMLDAMLVRGYSERTQQSYLNAIIKLAQYYHRRPDQISTDDIQAYFLYLVKERQLAPASCRLHLNGLRFFYVHVLHRGDAELTIDAPKRRQRIPELLTRDYRDGQDKVMALSGNEFVRRFLLHVLPDGFMRIRHYGFLANRCRRSKLARIRQAIGQPTATLEDANKTNTDHPGVPPSQTPSCVCPQCHKGRLYVRGEIAPQRPNGRPSTLMTH